jgi:RNA polymerase sigma factor (sigma-70 family)
MTAAASTVTPVVLGRWHSGCPDHAGGSRTMFKFAAHPQFEQSFRSGDREALERIYSAYVDEVAAIIGARLGRIVGRRGVADAEDLVHEVFTRAFAQSARASYAGRADYGAYLATIARNLVATWARRRRREPITRDPPPCPEVAARQPDCEPEWPDAETMAVVERYLVALPVDLRRVHERRYMECLSEEAASRALGLSRQQLRTRLKHLRDGLRRELARAQLRPDAQLSCYRP